MGQAADQSEDPCKTDIESEKAAIIRGTRLFTLQDRAESVPVPDTSSVGECFASLTCPIEVVIGRAIVIARPFVDWQLTDVCKNPPKNDIRKAHEQFAIPLSCEGSQAAEQLVFEGKLFPYCGQVSTGRQPLMVSS